MIVPLARLQARVKVETDKIKSSDETYSCTFDLQKALPFPNLSTFIAY